MGIFKKPVAAVYVSPLDEAREKATEAAGLFTTARQGLIDANDILEADIYYNESYILSLQADIDSAKLLAEENDRVIGKLDDFIPAPVSTNSEPV